ncbi:hypothetical protein [Actinomyces sp. Z5]|uniref:hypothetical protein n=1 Tax=Actinomyces sp. Z5 TaxID=2250216 RepID=UPI0015EBB2C8|nr:hypothetical protein [Actinomyces sp. Z5]
MNKYFELMGDPATGQPITTSTTATATAGTATATTAAGSSSSFGAGGGGGFGGGDGAGAGTGGLPAGEYGGGTGGYAGGGSSAGGGYAGGGGFGGSGGSFGGGSASGGSSAGGGNPLVAQAEDSSTGLSGLRLVEDGQDVVDALKTDSWVDDALAGFGTVADTVALVTDPIGEVLGSAIGWAIEHLDPLKTWLYELTGDPGQVTAGADTWANIATKLNACSVDLTDSIQVRLGGQSSEAVNAYKSFQADNAARLSLAASLAGGISKGLTVASVIVQIVHEMVRDAIADVLAKLTTKLAATVVTAGVAAIWAIPSLASDVFKWATRLEREVTAVVRSASSLGDVFKRATTLMDNLSDGLKGLGPHPAMANMGPVPHTPRTPSTPRAGRTPPRAGGGGKGSSGKGAGKGGQSPRSPQPKPQPKTVDPKPVIGGKSKSGPSRNSPNAKSQAAYRRAQDAKRQLPKTERNRTKAVSSDHNKTLSGWGGNRPSEFHKPNVDEVLAKQREIGHPPVDMGGRDHGVLGQCKASHAERQQSLIAKEPDIGVSKNICPDCMGYFRKLAAYEGREWRVTDPRGTWLFRPDGSVVKP